MFKMILLQKTKLILYKSIFYTLPLVLTINIFDIIQNNNKFTKKNNFLSYDERMNHLLNHY